eukprot:7336334-Prymnesium_polylepis.1
MKIDEATTPFLYYSESVSRDESCVKEFNRGGGPQKVDIQTLQARLGTLAFAQEEGEELRHAEMAPVVPEPPAPWLVLRSRSDPTEHFFFNPATQEATWEMPPEPALPIAHDTTDNGGAQDFDTGHLEDEQHEDGDTGEQEGEGEEEDVPLYTSRLATHGEDCATTYARALANGSRGPSR